MLLLVWASSVDRDRLISEKLMIAVSNSSTGLVLLDSLELLLLLVSSISSRKIDRMSWLDIPQVVDLITNAWALLLISHYMTFAALGVLVLDVALAKHIQMTVS